MRKKRIPCSGKAAKCKLLLSLFVLLCSKVPSIALTFAVSQRVALTLNLVLQPLNINVLDLRMKVDIILWHCSGKVTASTNKFAPIR